LFGDKRLTELINDEKIERVGLFLQEIFVNYPSFGRELSQH
jgi:hypothetical protein